MEALRKCINELKANEEYIDVAQGGGLNYSTKVNRRIDLAKNAVEVIAL
jgi:hypothetical protein